MIQPSATAELPLPPPFMMNRVGNPETRPEQLQAAYTEVGERCHRNIVGRLPDGWAQPGRRLLDFGAGAGRVLRHFGPEQAAGVELWGCDIDAGSVKWAGRNLPGAVFFQNREEPELDLPDEHFDLIYAMSVFTHITSHWTDWLIELRRVMRPGGILVASFLGESMFEQLVGDPYDENEVGMLILKPGASWNEGGPTVFHSKWWLEAHWSPAFDLVEVSDNALARAAGSSGQGIVVGTRTGTPPDRTKMVAVDCGDPREASALANNVKRLAREAEYLRHGSETVELVNLRAGIEAQGEELQRNASRIEEFERSLSWRLTKPLRRIKGLLRKRPRS